MAFLKLYMTTGKSISLPGTQSIPTENNLAITPALMAEMVDRGLPVSSQSLSGSFFDGVDNPSWDIPIDLKRGVDVAEIWSVQKSARKNITSHVELKPE